MYILEHAIKNFNLAATCKKCGSDVDVFVTSRAVLELECMKCGNVEHLKVVEIDDETLAMLEGRDIDE